MGMELYTYDPNAQEAEAEGTWVGGQLYRFCLKITIIKIIKVLLLNTVAGHH